MKNKKIKKIKKLKVSQPKKDWDAMAAHLNFTEFDVFIKCVIILLKK